MELSPDYRTGLIAEAFVGIRLLNEAAIYLRGMELSVEDKLQLDQVLRGILAQAEEWGTVIHGGIPE